jgi:DNA ligase (NAD+)
MYKEIEKLMQAAKAYYVDANPIMSDEAYDALFQKVRDFEIVNNIEDKLTDKVCLGYFEGDKACRVKHPSPMLSVENDNVRVIDAPVIITPKIDGAAVELWYVKGELVRKVTRGDGEYGSDITKIKIHNIPNCIPIIKDKIEIRGEVYCPTYKEYGKSHRNVVAGSLGKVDFEEDRDLYFIPYWTSLWDTYKTYSEELHFLKVSGFIPIPHIQANGPINLTNDFMTDLPYPIDGYVLRYNSNELYGEKTAHHYKGIWCWKCISEGKPTVIEKVTWKKSKNGIWTPVANVSPIELDDSIVSQVNLMHLDYIADKDIAIGDEVLVHKAKGIIPEIKEVLNRPDDREFIYLTYCPDCGNELVSDGIYLKCENKECSKDKFIEFFCKTIGIKGLALKNIEKLQLRTPLDLYSLTGEVLQKKLGAIGPKIYKEIQASIDVPVVKLIAALNPPGFKETMLKKIFQEYPNIEVMKNKETLTSIKGIGEKRADALCSWYINKFEPLLPLLVKIGFDLVPQVEGIKMEIGVTGTFPMTRNAFKDIMKAKGVEVKNLTKKSKLLVVGDKPSQSKIDKAKKYGISVVPYHDFIKDLNGTK